MYGSRKVNGPKVKFAQSTWNDRLKGVGFVSGTSAFDRDQEEPASPVAPPSPSPPSPAPPSPPAAEFEESLVGQMKEDEFTRHAREQTRAQLESITGRMFQVLNDFEGDESDEPGYVYLDDQVNTIENSQLKANIQLMIADYKDMCVEREELLHSLADWFDEGHIDDILEDMKHRRKSVAANPEGLRKSLIEGKVASQKLKVINDQIETAKEQGLPVEHLQERKAELEKEVMKSATLMENDNIVNTQEDVSTKVKDSWKFAAVEIYNLINQVRENGLEDVHEMEAKMRGLLVSMTQQNEVIDQLSKDLKHQKQIAAFSDMTTTQLSGDNSLLKDEVDMLRGELMEANETIRSLRSDIRLKTLEVERKGKAQLTTSKKDKRTLDTELARLELKVSQLTEENASLQQENQDLLLSCGRLERELEVARELFDEEVAGHKAELDILSSTMEEHRSMSRKISENTTKVTVKAANDGQLSEAITQPVIESSHEMARKMSAKPKTVTAERRVSQFHHTGVHHNHDHLFAKLADKEHQLKTARQEVAETRDMVQSLEKELEKLKRENTELVKLQERSAALINQASTCLQIKSEQSSDKSSQQSARVQQQTSFHQQSTASHQQSTVSHNVANSIIQTTSMMEAESFHKTVHVQSSERRSTSHDTGLRHQTSSTQESAKDVDSEEERKNTDPNVWSVLNSVDDGSAMMFGLPPERSAKEKQADSLQLVVELIDKLNAQQLDFVTADSKALRKIHTELSKVSQMVRNFLEYSTNLINDEAEVVSQTVDSLMEQLPSDEKPQLEGPLPPPGEKPNRIQQQRFSLADTSSDEQKRLKEKAVHFADQAIEVLKAGERMLTTKINTQQKRLNTVLHAMEDHRRRQSQFFKFEAPDEMGLVLEAHGVSKHNIASDDQQQQPQRKEQPNDYNRQRLERLRRYTGNGRSNAKTNLFYAFMRAGRFSNPFQGFAAMFPSIAEDSDDVQGTTRAGGFNMGIHGNGSYGRNTADLAISPQANTMRQEGTISLQFGNVGNYQRHQMSQDSADLTVGSSKPRKKAGKLHKPFHSNGANGASSRRDQSQSRQGEVVRQRVVNSNLAQMGRRWESSAYSQQGLRIQDGGSRDHKISGATFYDLLKHNTRSSRIQQQTATLLGDSTTLKLPPI